MNERFPRIRARLDNGHLAVCDGLIICFFMLRRHVEVAHAVLQSLEEYCRAVGPQNLIGYFNSEGDMMPLTREAWEEQRGIIVCPENIHGCEVELAGTLETADTYHFEYHGHSPDDPGLSFNPNRASAVAFWLPTEYLEKHGPAHVRELAVTLAGTLPICSGYVSLAFNYGEGYAVPAFKVIRRWCFRYPGLDIHEVGSTALWIGPRVRGAYWLNFYGSPLLEQLGGAAGLRERLTSPQISIQELQGERVLVSLGEWPEDGDTEKGSDMHPYRELARVLEPHHYFINQPRSGFSREDLRRWERRFLD